MGLSRRARWLGVILVVLCSCLPWSGLFVSFESERTVLPPTLTKILRDVPPVVYPAPEIPLEWKRPLTLTVHATESNGTVEMTLFTTGVDIAELGRSFKSVGCLIGDYAVPAARLQPAMVTCTIRRDLLVEGMPVTVVVQNDEVLRDALQADTQTLGGETFSFQAGDVVPLAETSKDLEEFGEVASIRTLVKWHDGHVDEPTGVRHELCLMTAMRQYPYLLKDWIAFYRRMGVDKFYIYENWATEDLNKLVGDDFVEVVRWPWVRSQMQSNNHFLLASKARCKYTAYFDADEFAMIGGPIEKNMLKKYIRLRSAESYTEVVFHFLMMLNEGYVRRPRGALPSLYTRREKSQAVKLGKPVIDNDVKWDFHKIHLVARGKESTGETYWNTTMELEPTSIRHNAMLVHYTKRSWEEFVVKNKVGGASVMTKGRPHILLDIDEPDEEYMSLEKSVKFVRFKDRWEKTMRLADDGRMTLTRSMDGFDCRRQWCPRCLMHREGEEECVKAEQE